jgi:cell division septation protein DedD
MKTRLPHILFPTFCGMIAMSGCGSTPETLPTPPPQPPQVQAPPKMEFETRTDTVASEHAAERGLGSSQNREPQIRFMVQIGAFKEPQNASRVQVTARERYRFPVLNDYQSDTELYQVRIGFFASKDSAYAFRDRLQKEHPDDYKDSWVVQLNR